MMIVNNAQAMPEYTDGYFTLYDIVDVTEESAPDFPIKKIQERKFGGASAPIWFRQLAVYDRTRAVLEQTVKEVTMKIRIPLFNAINSNCVCVIDGVQHKVYNKADVLSRQNVPETELTLVKPEQIYEVYTHVDQSTT